MRFLHSKSFTNNTFNTHKIQDTFDYLTIHQQDVHVDYQDDQYHQVHLRHVHANSLNNEWYAIISSLVRAQLLFRNIDKPSFRFIRIRPTLVKS